jgi:hypothetical protein
LEPVPKVKVEKEAKQAKRAKKAKREWGIGIGERG